MVAAVRAALDRLRDGELVLRLPYAGGQNNASVGSDGNRVPTLVTKPTVWPQAPSHQRPAVYVPAGSGPAAL
jgi:hypothetical protein